jgi:catechol 2,3-dioxygenase-like lactoylglutathione lyase family enzyme
MSEANVLPIPELKLELVPVSVSNLDRAKAFYVEQLGFHVDHDVQPSDTVRVIQLTPTGSACSILLGPGCRCRDTSRLTQGATPGRHRYKQGP